MTKKKNHYETLGVDKSASKEEIKKTYKEKAKKAHPDKGGSEEEMTALTLAYSVLGNEEKRKFYDETGEDSQSKLDQDVRLGLVELLNNVLLSDATDEIAHAKKLVKLELESAEEQLYNYSKIREKVVKKMAKFKFKGKTEEGEIDFVQVVLKQHLENTENSIKKIEKHKKVAEEIRKELEKYEAVVEKRDDVGVSSGFQFLRYNDWIVRGK